MKPLAFRWRIALGSACVTALALAMFSAIVAYALYRQDIGELDTRLATDAEIAFAFRKETRATGDGWIETLAKADPDLGGYALLGPKREVQLASPAAYASLAKHTKTGGRAFSHVLQGVRLRVGEFIEDDTTLLLAAEPKDADQDVRELLEGYALALPFVLLLAGGGGWWLAGRALQPMVQITRKAELITADRLAERLPQHEPVPHGHRPSTRQVDGLPFLFRQHAEIRHHAASEIVEGDDLGFHPSLAGLGP